MMEILEIKQANDALAEMVALFRVELRSYIRNTKQDEFQLL